MAQPHNKKLGEYPMTTRGREQGPEKRYRRLRFPAFTAAKWTTANPLLQRGELGVETDTRKIKVGDGITYWNDLEYAKAYSDWGNIAGDITEQTDLVDFVNAAVAAEANIRSQADQQLQANIDNVAADLSAHEQDTNNPHDVTKAQVGLGNVDNTSDTDKPVSNAQATAINNAVSEHNTSDTAHSNLFSQYRTSANQDNIDSNLQSQITNNDTDITNLQNTKADKATTLAGYGITDAYTKTEVDAKVSSVYRFRGSVATYANLPTTGQVVGDVWNVEDTGANYAWSGSEWDKLSETVDLTPYLTKADAANTYATITTVNGKQDTLTTDQLAAVNSGITADHVASYDAYAGEISAAQSTADKADNAAEAAQQTANLAGQEAAQALSGLAGKVNIAQGTANAGKVLGVGNDGNVVPVANTMTIPTGATITFAGNTAPDGYLACDGSAVSQSAYANLFAVIGTKFSHGVYAWAVSETGVVYTNFVEPPLGETAEGPYFNAAGEELGTATAVGGTGTATITPTGGSAQPGYARTSSYDKDTFELPLRYAFTGGVIGNGKNVGFHGNDAQGQARYVGLVAGLLANRNCFLGTGNPNVPAAYPGGLTDMAGNSALALANRADYSNIICEIDDTVIVCIKY